MTRALLFGLPLLLAACSVGPDYRPAPLPAATEPTKSPIRMGAMLASGIWNAEGLSPPGPKLNDKSTPAVRSASKLVPAIVKVKCNGQM